MVVAADTEAARMEQVVAVAAAQDLPEIVDSAEPAVQIAKPAGHI